MERLHQVNPFSKRDSHSPTNITTYRILTVLTWALAVASSVYYSIHAPADDVPRWRHSIPRQNYAQWTGFTLNIVLVNIYFVVLFAMQALSYVPHLFSENGEHVNAACSVGSHFIANNLLHFAFVMLFVRGHFVWAEVILVVNFFNLSSLYFRHNTYPRFIHAPVVSGPLAWTFVAIYWNGAISVWHPDTLVARVFANIFVWSILAYGGFFIVLYKDYTMGLWLSVLSAALGVAQFERQIIAFQWIFAFIIMALLFIGTIIIAIPGFAGGSSKVADDGERAPLLTDN